MTYPRFNKKSIEAPYDSERTEDKKKPKYPWVTGSVDDNGRAVSTYANPDKPDESFHEELHHNAGFDINEFSKDKNGLKNSLHHETRSYNSGGASSTSDSHTDAANLEKKSSHRENFKGDRGQSAGGDIYSGAGGHAVGGSKGGGYNHDNGDSYNTSTGNRVSEHTGNTSVHHEGDKTSSVTGNKADVVKGQYQMNIQGNMDIQVDSGKFRVKSGAQLTITSDTEVKIIVGGSTVTITPSGVVIESGGTVNINASGDITTQGSSTKVQGGGVSAPPTTFIG